MAKLSGLDFVALQVRNLTDSASFYENILGLKRAPYSPSHAIVYDTQPIPFALREPLVDLELTNLPGHGVALWFLTQDSQELFAQLKQSNVEIIQNLQPSPFGQTFSFRDPDGYVITVHDRAE